MRLLQRAFLRVLLIISIAFVSMSLTQNAKADAPTITVTPIWHPGTQLSTIDTNGNRITEGSDDLRYVDLEIDVTTNVQFWAMELTCTVNKAVLETYVVGGDPFGPGDDTLIVTWGLSWTQSGAQVMQAFNPATGAMTIASANRADTPLGKNTITSSFPLATIRYRVKPVTTAMTSTLSCTGSFLNADGKPVLAPVFVMPPALNIIPAYTISGNVSYQGRTTKSGIGIHCAGPAPYDATTDASGNFVIPTRKQGNYGCVYFGNTSVHSAGAPDLYIQGSTQVALNTLSYKILPVSLPGGNIDHTSGGTQTMINFSDLALVTSNYGITAGGDADGDGKTTKSDLAIVAGNYGLSEVYVASHILYGLTTGLVTNGSRIWVGRPGFGKVTQQIPGTNVDNWPALSPNGSKIVVTRRLGNPIYRYALFIMNSDGTGVATQLTPTTGPNGNYDAYAASWSPDGSQIAFNCVSNPGSGVYFDDASLCVIDAAGHSFRVLDTHVHIYPPAWLDNARLLYAGNSHHTTCPNFLCRVPMSGGVDPIFYDAQAGGAVTYVDMPSVSNGALFYRTLSGGFGNYRMAELAINGFVLTGYPSAVPPYHVALPLSGVIDYYAVKTGGRDVIIGNQGATNYWAYTYNGAGGWNNLGVNSIPDQVNDPAWNGTPESFSYVYALRNSFAWVP